MTFAFPVALVGPVDFPPSHRHRPPLPRPGAWQGVPACVRAPQGECFTFMRISPKSIARARASMREEFELPLAEIDVWGVVRSSIHFHV